MLWPGSPWQRDGDTQILVLTDSCHGWGGQSIHSFIFPATWTVSAQFSHPASPAVGLTQLRVLHSPLTPSAAAPSAQQGKPLPGGAPGSSGCSIPAPEFLCSHQEQCGSQWPGGFLQRELQDGRSKGCPSLEEIKIELSC